MLSNRAKRTFLSIANGKITHKDLETGAIEMFDNLDGNLKGITKREANFADGKTFVFDFTFVDGGEEFVLSCPAYGGVARGIILSLANIQNPAGGRIKISTYRKGDYTNTAVYFNGQNIKWIADKLPAIDVFTRNGKEYTDDSDRVAFIDGLVENINGRIVANTGLAVEPDGDMPTGEDFDANYAPDNL